MDQEIMWTDVILNTVESQNLPGSPVFPSDGNVPYIDLSGDDSPDLSIWNSGGPSSSRRSLLDQVAHEGIQMEHGWASSLTINGSQGSRTEERQLESTNMLLGSRIEEGRMEATNMLSVENVNLNLNSNPMDGSQPFSQNPNFLQNSDQNAAHAGSNNLALEAAQFSVPFIPGSSGSVHVPSSGGSLNLPGSSSGGPGFLLERGEGASGNSFDGRRLSCKRKSIEGVSAQCSASGSPSCLYHGENSLVHSFSAHQSANTTLSMSSSSHYPSGTNPSGEQVSPRIGTALTVGAAECHPYNVTGSTESSQRNCRIRINPAQHVASPPNQWATGNNLMSSDLWFTHQASNSFVPFNQSLESREAVTSGTLDSQSPALSIPGLVQSIHPFPVNVASSSRTSSSSRSPAVAVQRSSVSREETNSRNLPRNNTSDHPTLAPPADIRHLMQHSSSWSLAPASQAGTSSQVAQSSGPTWIPPQNPASNYQRRLPVVARRSLVPSVRTASPQNINVLPQPSGPSNTLQEMRNQRAAILRSFPQSYMRSANGVLGDLSSMRARESRSRVLSEIRNALARRGEHILDGMNGVFFLDPAILYGGAADLHDRHRDMRLDVDNMSYEELLALTERIGNVSTGLTEETILKCLKQRKYISLSEETTSEVEPCCICQEEYVEEDVVGRLDCGHDFHTVCIKQWLTMKNLCPICKTTGMVTSNER